MAKQGMTTHEEAAEQLRVIRSMMERSGKFISLQDWDITEKAPFSSADVTVSNPTYFEDTVSELLLGASLSLELNLGKTFALILDTKMLYLNPKVTNLGKRTNLFQLQPSLGFQLSF